MRCLLDALRSVEFLDGAGEAAVSRFRALGNAADHAKGHQFWSAGAAPQSLVVPVTGEAKTSTCNAEGREFIDRFVGPGDCVGLPGALDGLPHATGAQVTRAGAFFSVPRAALVRFLDGHPAERVKAIATIGALYRRAMKEREDVALRPVPQRVAAFLLRHGCARETDGARVLLHATQAEVGARLGTVREVVSRVYGDFQQRGILGRDDHGMFISDWAGLEAEADGGSGGTTTDRVSGPARAARTRRHFLPMAERRRRRERVEDAASCRGRLGDLSICCERGCPVALDDRAARTAASPSPQWRDAAASRATRAAEALQRA